MRVSGGGCFAAEPEFSTAMTALASDLFVDFIGSVSDERLLREVTWELLVVSLQASQAQLPPGHNTYGDENGTDKEKNFHAVLPPAPACLVGFDKGFDRAIIGFFYVVGKHTGWQLSRAPVIGQAFTANPFARTGTI